MTGFEEVYKVKLRSGTVQIRTLYPWIPQFTKNDRGKNDYMR